MRQKVYAAQSLDKAMSKALPDEMRFSLSPLPFVALAQVPKRKFVAENRGEHLAANGHRRL
jgi:hypothetical protein